MTLRILIHNKLYICYQCFYLSSITSGGGCIQLPISGEFRIQFVRNYRLHWFAPDSDSYWPLLRKQRGQYTFINVGNWILASDWVTYNKNWYYEAAGWVECQYTRGDDCCWVKCKPKVTLTAMQSKSMVSIMGTVSIWIHLASRNLCFLLYIWTEIRFIISL